MTRDRTVLGTTNTGAAAYDIVSQQVEVRLLTGTNWVWATNQVFRQFNPGSLHHAVWTNVMARTNGREMQLWSKREHPPNWPTNPPVIKWNPRNLMWGMRGMTGISPCWEMEGSSGQVPITALTRRHGYARGHGMGADGFNTRRAGLKVWFLTAANKLVEVKITQSVVRSFAGGPPYRDYTILLFDRDLPAGIEPVAAGTTNLIARYQPVTGAPWVMFKTEQWGNVSAELPGFTFNTWKGGDSGSPNLVPLGKELVFISGRSTSGPSAAMQADMDELCRLGRLDPKKYQMRWVDR